jgi:hypothetical protein
MDAAFILNGTLARRRLMRYLFDRGIRGRTGTSACQKPEMAVTKLGIDDLPVKHLG